MHTLPSFAHQPTVTTTMIRVVCEVKREFCPSPSFCLFLSMREDVALSLYLLLNKRLCLFSVSYALIFMLRKLGCKF